MTYKKPLKGFSGTTLMGEQIDAVDTATSRIGSDAVESFEAHKTIKTEVENRKMLTPFHAVKSAQYGVFTEDTERTDPYCGGGTELIDHVCFNKTECQEDSYVMCAYIVGAYGGKRFEGELFVEQDEETGDHRLVVEYISGDFDELTKSEIANKVASLDVDEVESAIESESVDKGCIDL